MRKGILERLAKRHSDQEEGFTLIELMVVVLIIAILMAIAIPTFLSAKNTANNRAAQSDLRNALTVEQTLFTHDQLYYGAGSSSGSSTLAASEPNLSWVSASGSSMAKSNAVEALTATDGSAACLLSSSVSGNVYAIYAANGFATQYFTGPKASDPFSGGCPVASATAPSSSSGSWSTTPW
ncbi:MAG: prepilin-type N-terminal cleavage/methylation domain-containing protein [Actinomycetota bacterium]|nr:prepilin-type N-terminal cleavage/methylation domain-containing protein [Actinomycetota bacterium]